MFRKTIFWLHLTSGVSAGVVVLMMSVTGVVLTYERQAQVWEDRSYYAEPEEGQQMMTADQLIAASRSLEGFEPTSLMLNSDPTAPAVLRQGRSQTQYLNPYSGEAYNPHSDAWSGFFATVRGWHRWFNMTGDNRSSARVSSWYLAASIYGYRRFMPAQHYARASGLTHQTAMPTHGILTGIMCLDFGLPFRSSLSFLLPLYSTILGRIIWSTNSQAKSHL